MRGAGVVQATRNSWVRRMTAKEVMRFACAAQLAAPLCCFSFRFFGDNGFPKGRGRFAYFLMHPPAGIAGAQLPE